MGILTVNTGSSSVKLALFRHSSAGLQAIAHETFERSDDDSVTRILERFLAPLTEEVSAIAHRVVHGGDLFSGPTLLTTQQISAIGQLAALAPLHNPVALAWIQGCRARFGEALPQVALFDTAFYADLPPVARNYALPRELLARHRLRRYGFHGIAHRAMWRRFCQLRPDLDQGGRVISLQLGSGCSITATAHGQPQDTSMGFTPLEGLTMATRAGDVDPGLLLWLMRNEHLSAEELEHLLNHHSGLLGLSGKSKDMRELLAEVGPDSRLAVDFYAYRARKYIGAYLAVLGGADAILFGGGVGENAGEVRARILAGMEWCGIALDPQSNGNARSREARISRDDAPVAVWTIPVDEASELAAAAEEVLGLKG